MTEKRYYAYKHLLQENKVHDKICHNFMNLDETVEHMNNQYWKYKQLKQKNQLLKKEIGNLGELHAKEITKIEYAFDEEILQLEEENKQLKKQTKGLQSELHIFKEDVAHSNNIINKLNDKNEQLKSELKSLRKKYNDFSNTVDKRLQEMNKELIK